MSTRVAVDSVVWFSLADRAGVGVVVRRCPAVVCGSVTHEQPWSCSVPCAAPGRELSLGAASRGSRAVIRA